MFVADAIPPELRRIVEFLNGQMNPAEVVAVEVPQFVGQGLKALVPRLVGQTAAAQQAKTASRSMVKRKWDETSFFAELERRRGSQEALAARAILDWAIACGLRIWWGEGSQEGSFYPMLDCESGSDPTVCLWTNGRVEVQFQWLARRRRTDFSHPFAGGEQRNELRRRLNELPGVNIPETAITKRPSFALSVLIAEDVRLNFLGTLTWLISEIRAAQAAKS